MARCETCGNDYDKAFQVSMNGSTHTFDSFECRDPRARADLRELRHSYCRPRPGEGRHVLLLRAHCAEVVGVTGLRDRVGASAA